MNLNRIQQANVSVTKIMGRHTAKAGFYFEHSYKAQNIGANTSFQAVLNMAVDTNNPLDSQFPYANTALGVYSSYAQGSRFLEGNFYYNNIEWYLQDNWKVNGRLTLDYGVRVAHDGPYTDEFKQVANFFEDRWSLANAPVLYVPGLREQRESLLGQQQAGERSAHGRSARSGYRRRSSDPLSSARETSPTVWCRRATGFTRRATPIPARSSRRGSAWRTT